ncbi:hypothetical protein DFH27DRAFT_597843 [Peziza echinospora]|nr:hypothetical protein DFH27DRAFT_597843 [Peziza echinospora]
MPPPPAAMASALPPRKKRKPRPPIRAKIVLEPDWRGDVGFVSEDIWKDLFGPLPRAASGEGDTGEAPPDPPVYHLAIALPVPSLTPELTVKQGRWTTLPVTLAPPATSQFPSLPPSTILFPDNAQSFTCLSAFKASLPPPRESSKVNKKRTVSVLATNVDLVGLETIIISVTPPATYEEGVVGDEEVEEMVRYAVKGVKVLHRDDILRLGGRMRGREARIELSEPVDQGVILPKTKIVVVKDNSVPQKRLQKKVDGVILLGGRREVVQEEEEEDDDYDSDDTGVSNYFNLPALPGLPGTTLSLRNGPLASNNSLPARSKTPSSGGNGKNFKPQSLCQKIPHDLLHPRPKEGEEDDEARIYVDVNELVGLRTFSGDWVGISLPPPATPNAPPPTVASRAPQDPRKRGAVNTPAAIPLPEWEWRPVRIFSLPDAYLPSLATTNTSHKSKKGKGVSEPTPPNKPIVYISPILLANITPSGPQALSPPPELHIFPLPFPPPTAASPSKDQATPPAAKEVTLLRVASPTSTDRALQPSLLLALKTHFESARRLVKKGDLIAVTVDEVLARSLFGEDAGGVAEELLLGQNSPETPGSSKAGVGGGVGEGGRVLAWFKVGNIAPAASTSDGDSDDDKKWGGVVYVDPASTRMVQAGTEKRKVPPTIYSTWEYYLNLRPLPLFLPPPGGYQKLPAPLRVPYRFVSPVLRRLRELISAATSPRAIHLNLPPISILITSTQRSVGKKTVAMRAAADVGVHMFHIDAYDVVSEGNNGDVKTEAFLRVRVERALACGKENTVLLISHVEAFGGATNANSGGGGGKIVELLKELVSGWRVVVGTTSEVEKLGDSGGGEGGGGGGQAGGGIRGVFTHELEISAPDEGEREGLLKGIVEEKGVSLGEDVQLSSVAVKTAALVAGDLLDVVERSVAGARERVNQLVKRLANSPPPVSTATPEGAEVAINPISLRDLYIAGGDEVRSVLMKDFETAVEAARRNFADSIGAPKIPNVSWDDVGGLANVKSAVMETIQLPLERPELFARGMKKRSGILFYGPPGTGKTLLAKAIATEFSLNFFSVKGPELLNMYIGESEANVRRVFQRARDARPCVVFFDELDSVAPKRGNQGDSGGVMDRIVSQLLAELDGMSEGKEGSGGVFVVGATNRPDLLDAALLRPGRFDKMLYLGVSDTHDKQLTILEALTRKFALHPNLSLRRVAETLPFTYTGADLYALCSDAMLKAITRQAERVEVKVAETCRRLGKEVSTGWWFDHEAGPDDVKVVVEDIDFEEARLELVGSVSAKELEHYNKVRRQFELTEAEQEAEKKALREENAKSQMLSLGFDPKGKGKGRFTELDDGDDYDDHHDMEGYATLSTFPPDQHQQQPRGQAPLGGAVNPRLNLSLGSGSLMALWKEKDGDSTQEEEEEEDDDDERELSGSELGEDISQRKVRLTTGSPTSPQQQQRLQPVRSSAPSPELHRTQSPYQTSVPMVRIEPDVEEVKVKVEEKPAGEEGGDDYPLLPTIKEEDDERSDLSAIATPNPEKVEARERTIQLGGEAADAQGESEGDGDGDGDDAALAKKEKKERKEQKRREKKEKKERKSKEKEEREREREREREKEGADVVSRSGTPLPPLPPPTEDEEGGEGKKDEGVVAVEGEGAVAVEAAAAAAPGFKEENNDDEELYGENA